ASHRTVSGEKQAMIGDRQGYFSFYRSLFTAFVEKRVGFTQGRIAGVMTVAEPGPNGARQPGYPLAGGDELPIEQSTRAKLRIGKRLLYGIDHVAAEILAGEHGPPFLSRLVAYARGHSLNRCLGILPIVARLHRQRYHIAESL